eukprot:1533262-Amphidinium_carterae.1
MVKHKVSQVKTADKKGFQDGWEKQKMMKLGSKPDAVQKLQLHHDKLRGVAFDVNLVQMTMAFIMASAAVLHAREGLMKLGCSFNG